MRLALSIFVLALLGAVPASATVRATASVESPSACAPGYSPCLPVVGDLDCGDILDSKKPIRVTGSDQYSLDRDGDGVACEIDGQGFPPPTSTRRITYRLSLEKPLGTTIKQIHRGEKFRVVIWSPNLPFGRKVRYGLCVNKTKGEQCYSNKSWNLTFGYRRIGFWVVTPNEGRHGVLTITLKVEGQRVASKSLRLLAK